MKSLLKLTAVVLLTLAAVACGSKYTYESVENDPLQTRIYTLDNGLKVYMTVNKETPRIQTYIAVRVGGKNDPAETTGLAHYFEHLMFKGTQSYGTQNYEQEKPMLDQIEQLFEVYRKTTDEAERKALYRQIDSISYEASKIAIPNEYDKLMAAIGAEGTNAYTSFDQTVYVEDIPANEIENWAKIQADRFKNIVIRGFHTELETIYEEKNMSLTQDSRKVYEAMMAALFPHHPYGTQTVLGTQEHLKNPSITNVKRYHDQWYVPNNMAICLSGDFDPDEMITTIDKYFGDMKPNENLPKLQFQPEQPITAPVVKEVLGPDAETVTLAWRLNGAGSTDNDLATLVGSILYNGKAGLFDLDLNQQQKVLAAYGYPIMLADYGSLLIQGRPKAGQSLEDVQELLLAEIAKLRNGEFDESLLQATINNLKADLMAYRDTNEGRADLFVQSFVNGTDWKDEVEQLDRLSQITKEQVVAFAQEKFQDNNYAVIYKRQGQDPYEQKIAKPEITPIFTNRDTASQFLRDIQAAPVKPIEPVFVDFDKDLSKLTAKSDLPLLYKQNTSNGLFTLIYVFETGQNNDPLLSTAADYLDYLGTGSKSAEQIKQEFYNIACSFRIVSQSDRTFVLLSGLSENMGQAIQLFEDLLANAQPNETVLANLKGDLLKVRTDAKLNQRSNFAALQRYIRFGSEQIKAVTPSNEALTALTSEELLGKLRDLRNKQHTILYYGPEKADKALSIINELHYIPEAPEALNAKRNVELETKENNVMLAQYDAKQIYMIQNSNRGEQFDVANDPIIALYNEYFGGGMNSIVFQEMREARGLAYTAQAALRQPGYANDPYTFYAFIATQNDKMGAAIDAFEEIINDMPESEAAFQIAKESLLNRMRTQRTIKADILWSYLDAQDMGVTEDRNKAIFEQVQNLTLEDVKAFQEKWIKGRQYTYGILGDIQDLDMEKLRSLGPVTVLSQEDIFGY